MAMTDDMIAAAQAEQRVLCDSIVALIRAQQPEALPLTDDERVSSRAVAIVTAALADILGGALAVACTMQGEGADKTVARILSRVISACESYDTPEL